MQKDVVIIGAGAAGLMCGIESAKRGRKTLILDHASKIAEKIRISGGGRCNFTNIHSAPDRFLSENPNFVRSALMQFTQHDFVKMVERHNIPYHEKTLGQLFCDKSSGDIIKMLLDECRNNHAEIATQVVIEKIEKGNDGYIVSTSSGKIVTASVVIASGGLSIPKIGASNFGYKIAEQFGLKIIPPRAGLVPLTFDAIILNETKNLSGIAIDPVVIKSRSGKNFEEALLFTHRGISGPAVLQISSYWKSGEEITVDMAPYQDMFLNLKSQKKLQPRSFPHTILAEYLPKRLAQQIVHDLGLEGNMADQSDKKLQKISDRVKNWIIKPSGSEGYRTAEVTLGGVDTQELSPKTMESIKNPGLYFIGEVVDVTGHLGGYNFQWAWSSGWCAGQNV